jgi:hypothetical protein
LAGICKKQALLVTVIEKDGNVYSIEHEEITPKFIADTKK